MTTCSDELHGQANDETSNRVRVAGAGGQTKTVRDEFGSDGPLLRGITWRHSVLGAYHTATEQSWSKCYLISGAKVPSEPANAIFNRGERESTQES
jgi:hypothetical protein